MQLDCNGKVLDLARPQVMGVLNVTPDSFSDGGDFFSPEKAVQHALRMEAEGAAIIDIGGESTRPGAAAVPVEEELQRVIPVIEALQPHLRVPISVDTQKPEVMRAAVAAGAGMINDINALRSDGAVEAVAACGVPVCLMHMQGDPRTMQKDPRYDDVVSEVRAYLQQRAAACEQAGIARSRIVLDPGFGFGKSVTHNLRLLARLEDIASLGFPVLAGLSRKSMIGKLLEVDVEERLPARSRSDLGDRSEQGGRAAQMRQAPSIALAVLAVERGARLVRAHDVAATWQALQMVAALQDVH